ncbi:hypothetical protein ACD591_19010 [Rufibacter glacialis]|uniref:Lipocalin-like domain-containing protein n=1 Tax=Rufibacter glacialis TaxID=1259555 RepID=A0A5M8QPE2_9BACT|nr:hypothetical protein [Rufibacter glacialis]KAA6438087.1 hypothetical protein FOE74_00140 [Rufibacter glacialis]GGK88438.1 hypothetical protein GCM10011405_40240 [Rufibacter glacialis]
MKNYPLLLLLFCCTLFFTACSSDDDDSPSKEDMLKNKRWQITAASAAVPFFGSVDFYANLKDCQRDNYFEFQANGVLLINEGATKCTALSPQQVQGSWSLNGDIMTIQGLGATLGLPSDKLEIKLTDLSSTSLTGEFSLDYNGLPVTVKVTMRTM